MTKTKQEMRMTEVSYLEWGGQKIAQLEAINAELLEALNLILRCDEKGFINLKPAWHNQVRQAIRQATERV